MEKISCGGFNIGDGLSLDKKTKTLSATGGGQLAPVAKTADMTQPVGVDDGGKLYSLDKFVVTVTDDDSIGYTADKTLDEIVEAYEAGRVCECKIANMSRGFPASIQIATAVSGAAAVFCGSFAVAGDMAQQFSQKWLICVVFSADGSITAYGYELSPMRLVVDETDFSVDLRLPNVQVLYGQKGIYNSVMTYDAAFNCTFHRNLTFANDKLRIGNHSISVDSSGNLKATPVT